MNQKINQLTQEGYESIKNQLEYLKNVERTKNLEDLKEARAQGDLSENADYDAAREKQREIESEIKRLEETLANSQIISDSSTNLGKSIKFELIGVEDEDLFGDCVFKLISSAELLNGKQEDQEDNEKKISNESPLGAALMKAKVGEIVQVNSENISYSIKIVSIK